MAISWYENNTKEISSFYDTQYYRCTDTIATGFTNYYYRFSINVYNETPSFYNIVPHPTYVNGIVQPFEVVKAYHTKHFDPTIKNFEAIGNYDLYEFRVDMSGMTGATAISTDSSNKNIAHNHILQRGETYQYTTYILENSTDQFINVNKHNYITNNDYSTLYCFNGTFNCDATHTSKVSDAFYLLVYTDGTFKTCRQPLLPALQKPVQTTGTTLAALTNFKLSVPAGTKNISDAAGAGTLLQMASGTFTTPLLTATSATYATSGSSITGSAILTNLSYYQVMIATAQTSLVYNISSERIQYNIICSEKRGYTPYRIAWLNHLGGYDYWTFNMKSREGMELEKSEFRSTSFEWNLTNMDYERNEKKRVQTFYDMKGDETWVINTDWITDVEMTYLKDLFRSPDVWITYPSNATYYPIQIIDTSINIKKNYANELVQLTCSFKMNEGYRFQV